MMDILGKWKICAEMMFNDNFEKIWKSAEEILADKDMEDSSKVILGSSFIFCDDGYIRVIMPMPEDISPEEMEEAIAQGELELYNGQAVFDKHPYKIVGEKIMYDSGAKGEVLGEKVSPWVEIPYEDGKLQMFLYKLERAD